MRKATCKFKKSTYLITVKEKGKIVFKEKEGYTFSVEGFDFGICESGKGWDITEISSGTRIAFVSKRKDAVEEIKKILPFIEIGMKHKSNQKLIKMKEEYEKAAGKSGNMRLPQETIDFIASRFETVV